MASKLNNSIPQVCLIRRKREDSENNIELKITSLGPHTIEIQNCLGKNDFQKKCRIYDLSKPNEDVALYERINEMLLNNYPSYIVHPHNIPKT